MSHLDTFVQGGVYRIEIDDKDVVHVQALGITLNDKPFLENAVYDTVHDLPEWMQARIAVLQGLGEDADSIDGLGMMTSDRSFLLTGDNNDED